MLKWVDIIENYLIKYSTKLRKYTSPLRDHFGVSGFAYHRINNKGKYTLLCNRPDWIELYVEEKIYLNDPYLRHPQVYQTGMCLVEHYGTDDFKKHMVKFRESALNMDIDVLLIKKSVDFVEMFRFEANTKASSLQNIYAHHPQLLWSFADFFKNESHKMIEKMNGEESSLSKLKGLDFFENEKIAPAASNLSRNAFLKDIGLSNITQKAALLSPREKDCLKLLIRNKSAKETAAILGLSRRSIESYFENIKIKLSCTYKNDILQIAQDMERLGLTQ